MSTLPEPLRVLAQPRVRLVLRVVDLGDEARAGVGQQRTELVARALAVVQRPNTKSPL